MLDLSSTAMTGTLPSELGNLSNLKRLMLSHSRFDGSVPPEVFAITSLEKFHLTNNDFNGTLSSQIGNMKNVKEFMVRFRCCEVVLRYFCNNLTLSWLDLIITQISRNKFSGSIPTESMFPRRLHSCCEPAETSYLRVLSLFYPSWRNCETGEL